MIRPLPPTCIFWRTAAHEIALSLQGITGDLMIFSPDGNRLITITYDSILKVWDIAAAVRRP